MYKSLIEFTSIGKYFEFFALKLLELHKNEFYKKNPFLLKNYSTIWAHVRMDQRVETVRTALQYGAENCKMKKNPNFC